MGPLLRWILACAFLASCAPRACDRTDDQIARDVELLVGESTALAKAAQTRLVARGSEAVVLIEVGLYQADPPGRLRVIRTLAAIGDPEALPILDHLAATDLDSSVRGAAREAANALRLPGE